MIVLLVSYQNSGTVPAVQALLEWETYLPFPCHRARGGGRISSDGAKQYLLQSASPTWVIAKGTYLETMTVLGRIGAVHAPKLIDIGVAFHV